MRRNFAILGISLAVVGVLLILFGIGNQICKPEITNGEGPVVGGCGSFIIYWELYSGIFLLIVGITVSLISVLMKSNLSTKSIFKEGQGTI